MNATLLLVTAGVLSFLLLGAALAWWATRRHLAQLQRKLDRSEHARVELLQGAKEMSARLAAAEAARVAQPAGAALPAPARPTPEQVAEAVLAAAAAGPPTILMPPRRGAEQPAFWRDTEALGGATVPAAFPETQPVSLGFELEPSVPGTSAQAVSRSGSR
jgi:hypothetical protein